MQHCACRALHGSNAAPNSQADHSKRGIEEACRCKGTHLASCSWGEPTAEDQARMLPSAAMLTARLHAGASATTPAFTARNQKSECDM